MLVLSRKENEVLRIGDDITITVVRIHGNKIRLGIDAPREVSVMRGELLPLEPQAKAEKEADEDAAGYAASLVERGLQL